ncbi:DUF5336 domain-containing protein [Gordonia sp. PDNC005]|uniref:DUF5336 domain-containing protein n=1 Tax=unclassified Gordonia (in: high G+C Gram-positive bacteria) TaxID=2657482 RepID=UPI0019649649|nr:DUF5336 domain-containing protein [Gordonia sp. PDNC005]QRY63104.1 DUF5336 domain-containing protein [Gordonia sp. PDNC005]
MTQPPYPGQPGNVPSNPNIPTGGFDATTNIEQQGQQWGAQPAPQSQPFPGQQVPGQPVPGQYGQPMPGQYGQPAFGPPIPARPSFLAMLPLPYKLTLGSAVAGVITFFMGFLAWLTIDDSIERDADKWASDLNGSVDIPAFFSPTLLLSVGWFFVLLGAVAIATVALIAPKWRKFLPYLAFGAVAGWLGIFAASMGLPPFIGLGAGGIIALILGFVQAALLVAAVIIEGLAEAKNPPQN